MFSVAFILAHLLNIVIKIPKMDRNGVRIYGQIQVVFGVYKDWEKNL